MAKFHMKSCHHHQIISKLGTDLLLWKVLRKNAYGTSPSIQRDILVVYSGAKSLPPSPCENNPDFVQVLPNHDSLQEDDLIFSSGVSPNYLSKF